MSASSVEFESSVVLAFDCSPLSEAKSSSGELSFKSFSSALLDDDDDDDDPDDDLVGEQDRDDDDDECDDDDDDDDEDDDTGLSFFSSPLRLSLFLDSL